LTIYGGVFDIAAKLERIQELEQLSIAPDFWDDSTAAQAVMKELTRLRDEVSIWEKVSQRLAETAELAELDDKELLDDLNREVEILEKAVGKLEFRALFSSKYDDEPAILAIHAGAGGTEAQDWAQMLQRMFIRWAEASGYKINILDESPGDEAGIKSTLMSIEGDYVYGNLKSERGVHRLVRISPYDSSSRRHTSFAKVEVWPDVAEDIEITIDDKDLRIDRFRASGAGGQHVQKNETAIRITHLPTGIVVSCQNQRSLTQNLDTAMKILKSQLFDLERRKQDAEMAALKGEDVNAEWGNQIRSYVLHPYKMVKDHRTNYETGNTQAVLDGRLDDFMEAYLRHRVGQPT
jgi:peptide chain release factor 2